MGKRNYVRIDDWELVNQRFGEDWHGHFNVNDQVIVKDYNAWELLTQVVAIDLVESPNNYLYSLEDIVKWVTAHSNN